MYPLNITTNEISILVKNSSYIHIKNNNLYSKMAGAKFYNVDKSSISKKLL